MAIRFSTQCLFILFTSSISINPSTTLPVSIHTSFSSSSSSSSQAAGADESRMVTWSLSFPSEPVSLQLMDSDADFYSISSSEEADAYSTSDSSYSYSSSSYEDYHDSEEDPPCPWDHFWHIRGKQCVPHKCPRGNHLREWSTGKCLFGPWILKL
ncbi:unnamed protein product [Orchesella dallaii]|uniref:Uncharacterized protein n=1 Tax=Orchesella dallaii TaxID=48710 RepID=A0ABP1Q153_9HEXA